MSNGLYHSTSSLLNHIFVTYLISCVWFYLTTDTSLPYNLLFVSGRLMIHYSDNDVSYKEIIVKANSELLKIENDQGFVYSYKPYQPIIDSQ